MMLASEFTDNFPGTAINTTKWPMRYGPHSVANNTLTLVTTAAYTGVESTPLDFNQSSVFARIEIPTYSGGGREFYMEILATNENRFSFYWAGGSDTLYMRRRLAGANSVTNVAYNPTTMRYLRIRHSGSNVLFETSPDGLAWTTRRTVTDGGMNLSVVEVAFLAGDWAGEFSSPLHVSHVNTLSNAPATRFKVWNGSAWVPALARVYDGTKWVLPTAKRWTGSTWQT